MQLLISLYIAISLLLLRLSAKLLVFILGLIQPHFWTTYSCLFKARKICNTFKWIYHANSVNNGEEFGTNYCNIYR